MLKIYNTLTNKEQEFKPLQEGVATIYTCGPTVYGRPHIGNYSSFLMADLLVRWLEVSGYKVTHVKNITDVGHLAGDDTADATGEDKIERQAKKEAKDPLDVAAEYTAQYIADEQALNMREPEHRPKATETIQEMLTITKELLASGHAYETGSGIYFAVESFKDYGKLSGNVLVNMQSGSRVEVNQEKHHPADFALWKKCTGVNGNHLLRWSFATGERVMGTQPDASAGFPGWHIECSAMSTKFLGEQIDIHTGGEDNIFPHHECEIAQSESATGKQYVGYWLHRRRIDLGDTKMSKSLGNTLSLDDIQEMGFSPLDLRYYLLSVHYRTQLKFTKEGLQGARVARRKVQQWVQQKGVIMQTTDAPRKLPLLELNRYAAYKEKFVSALNSDLNTPAALGAVFECIAYCKEHMPRYTEEFDSVRQEFVAIVKNTFACFEESSKEEVELIIPDAVIALKDQRAAARLAKDFAESDRLRDEIEKLGYSVIDIKHKQKIVLL